MVNGSLLDQLVAIHELVGAAITTLIGEQREVSNPIDPGEEPVAISSGCQCTGPELPTVQNVAGAGESSAKYLCTGCGQEVVNVKNRQIVR